jgi:hypothetical protein
VQALTPTLFLCYAPEDRDLARRIAEFLERGAGVRVFLEEGEILPGEDLICKARQGRMADTIIVMFSRDSMPSRWPRAQWEGALVEEPAEEGVRIAFVRCDDCIPPRVLTPQFDAKQLRQLKRWVRNSGEAADLPRFEPPEDVRCPDRSADLEVLGIAIADRPGVETVDDTALAFEFVRAYREDFDEVFYIDCGGRSLAALTGDLAAQLGMRLAGPVQNNLERLHEFCSPQRFLVVLDDVWEIDANPLIFGGRCSTLLSTDSHPAREPDALQEVQAAMANPAGDWAELCRLARVGRRITREQGRIAECFELMRQWHDAAEERGDRGVLDESAREMVWILESWGMTDEAHHLEYRRVTEFDEQMRLPF